MENKKQTTEIRKQLITAMAAEDPEIMPFLKQLVLAYGA